jgi:hypothetical protein
VPIVTPKPVPGIAIGADPPEDGTNAKDYVVCDDPAPYVGTVKFTFGGQQTAAINLATETGGDAQAKLEALSTIGAGNIECISGESDILADNGGEWDFEFVGDLAGMAVGVISVTSISATANGVPMTSASFDVDSDAGAAPVPADALLYIDTGQSRLSVLQGTAWVGVLLQGSTLTTNLLSSSGTGLASGSNLVTADTPTLRGANSSAGDGTGATVVGGSSTGASKNGARVTAAGASAAAHGKVAILTNNSAGTIGQVLTADGNGSATWV